MAFSTMTGWAAAIPAPTPTSKAAAQAARTKWRDDFNMMNSPWLL
jgi:hypothetical protein